MHDIARLKTTKLFILIQDIGHNVLRLVRYVINKLVGILMMLLKLWTNDAIVNNYRSIAFNWKHAPNEEDTLKRKDKQKLVDLYVHDIHLSAS